MQTKQIVTAKYLKKCQLWKGSIFEGDFNFGGGISKQRVEEDIKKYQLAKERFDDLTDSEIEWIEACKKTLLDQAGNRDL